MTERILISLSVPAVEGIAGFNGNATARKKLVHRKSGASEKRNNMNPFTRYKLRGF